MAQQQKIIQSTRSGVASLISSAAVGKVLNFGANVLITRAIGRKVLGTGSLRLDDLLFLGPLVLTREGLRRAAYRSNTSNANTQQSLINLTWLVAPATVLVALAFAYVMFVSPPAEIASAGDNNVNDIDKYHRAMLYTLLAILFAVLTEPVFVLAQSQLRTSLRANIEMFAVLGKCLAMLYLTVGLGMDIEAFAIANIVYSFIPLCGYWSYFLFREKRFPRPKPLLRAGVPVGPSSSASASASASASSFPSASASPASPSSSTSSQWCTQEMQDTAVVFWWQSVQKWLLENGEKVILVFIGTTMQQGVYVVVDRLGSIIVRLLFQPAEEMTLATLGKLTALERSSSSSGIITSTSESTNSGRRVSSMDAHATKATNNREVYYKNHEAMTEMIHINFSGWLLLLSSVGLTFASFGPCFSHLLLHLLYGATWSATSAPVTLGWYCVYVLFMATNGVCEAFVQGTSTSKGIGKYNRWMVVFSIVYMCAVCTLLPLFGAVGLILANMIKMLCRIGVCAVVYIRPFFRERGRTKFTLTSLLPHYRVLGLFACSFVILQCTQQWVYMPAAIQHIQGGNMSVRVMAARVVVHVVCGVLCLAVTGREVWKHHGEQLKELLTRGEKRD